jgi:hypothetical protein
MTTNPNRFKKRKKLLIYPQFQLRLMGLQTSVTLGIFGVIYLLAYLSFERFKSLGIQAGLPPEHPYFSLIELQASNLLLSIGFTLFVGWVVNGYLMLELSQRLAGPVIRLKSFFKSIAETGKIPPLSFRQGDFFADLPHEINTALRPFETLTDQAPKSLEEPSHDPSQIT